MPEPIYILLNAASGWGSKEGAPEVLRARFTAAGKEAVIREVKAGDNIADIVGQMLSSGAKVVVAGGGDGTLNAVASVLAGKDAAMGVLAAGTLNHFARDLGIPFDLEQAADVILAGRTTQVDLGEINDRKFINNAIIGLYPFYRSQRERLEKGGRTKWRAIFSAAYSVVRANPAVRVTYQIDGRNVTRRTPVLMVGNNFHEMEGYRLGNRASLNSGKLWLYAMHRISRIGMFALTIRLLLGRFTKQRGFDVVGATELQVNSRRPTLAVSLDGEVVKLQTPLRYRSLPGALRVIVPSDYPAK